MRRAAALIGLATVAMLGATYFARAHEPFRPRASGEQLGKPPPVDSGRLAYIGADGNIYVVEPGHDEAWQVTNDATAPPEGPGLSYPRVAWSPDGQLAYASVLRSGNDAEARLYIKQTLQGDPQLVGISNEHFVIYIYWSPTGCTAARECSELTYLIEETKGIGLRLVRSSPGGTTNQLLGLGWPFYFSWSQDGERMLWHTGGASRFNEQAQLVHYSMSKENAQRLELQPGLFIAPAWSPSGGEWLGVTQVDGMDALQRISGAPGGLTLEILDQADDKHFVFAWSPDGEKLAYSELRRSGGLIFGPIQLHDLETGESRQFTSSSFDISGFFWSPDGSRLAYLSRLPLREAIWMQWRVIDVDSGEDRGFAAFNPTYQMRYVISSFNQYAQSHRLWSPDGRYLVYADQDDERVERVWIVDTFAERGSEPIFIGEGTMGFWSWK